MPGLKIKKISFKNCQDTCLAQTVRFLDCGKRSIFKKPNYPINRALKQYALQKDDVMFLSVDEYMCKNERCTAVIKKSPIYYDSGHFSFEGSKVIGELILQSKQGKILESFLTD